MLQNKVSVPRYSVRFRFYVAVQGFGSKLQDKVSILYCSVGFRVHVAE
jgi:hypothetical protein